MKSLLLSVLIAAAVPAHAGLKQGLAAHDRADYAAARKELLPLAEQGHAQAQYRLGKMANLGQGLPPDKKEAARWFHLAAQQGLAAAQGALGYLCSGRRGRLPEQRSGTEVDAQGRRARGCGGAVQPERDA